MTYLSSFSPYLFIGPCLLCLLFYFPGTLLSHPLSQFRQSFFLFLFSQGFNLLARCNRSTKRRQQKDPNDLLSRLFELIMATLLGMEISQRGVSEDLTTLGTFYALV
jgi:hypothetical protein